MAVLADMFSTRLGQGVHQLSSMVRGTKTTSFSRSALPNGCASKPQCFGQPAVQAPAHEIGMECMNAPPDRSS